MQLADMDITKIYSYADYYSWTFDDRVELIKGKLFNLLSFPGTIHQILSGKICFELFDYLKGKKIEAFAAPFDVRLPQGSNADKDIFTVVQPDICVIGDPAKIDARGCIGAPDIVVEILSVGDNRKELQNKYEVYEKAGILEYWIIQPPEKTFLKYTLVDGKYKSSRLLTFGDKVITKILPSFELNLDELFEEDKNLVNLY